MATPVPGKHIENDSAMDYGENDILLHVGPRALEAGRVYQRQRRVLEFERDRDRIFAKVQGNERRPYAQTIAVTPSAAGNIVIHSDCSCPVGENCKHVAAALLEGLARKSVPSLEPHITANSQTPQPEKQVAPELPPQLASWLNELEEARQRALEDYSDGQRQRIVYVFIPQTRYDGGVPRLELRILTTRLLKHDSFSPKAHSYDWRAALASPTPAKYLRPSDLRIFRKLAVTRNPYLSRSSEFPFEEDGALELLDDILATGRARWLEVGGAALTLGPTRPGRIVWDAGDGAEMRLRLDAGDGRVALNAAPPVYVDADVGLIGALDLGLAPKLAFRLVDAPPAPIEHVALLSERMTRKLPDLAPLAPPPPAPPVLYTEPPKFVLRLMRGELPVTDPASPYYQYYGWQPPTEPVGLARVIFRYGHVDVGLKETKGSLTRFCDGGLVEIHRDRRLEAAALETLRANGFIEVNQKRPRAPQKDAHDFLPDDADEFAWLDALYHDLPRLQELGWRIEIDPDFPVRLIAGRGEFNARLGESTGIDWLELDIGVAIDGETIDLIAPIVAMISAAPFDPRIFDGEADDDAPFYLPLADGRFLALPRVRLAPIVAAIWELSCGGALNSRDGRLRLSPLDFAGLAEFEATAQDAGLSWRGGDKLREMGRKLTAHGGLPEVSLPESFLATLRPYQAQGLAWLAFLHELGLGGVLADDMGLGKTVQALALVVAEKAAGRLETPALVIAPTSLMANWRREAEKFAPDLKVVILQGGDRKKRFDEIDAADLVLSTYPLISRDHETLAAHQWSLLFLDEAQTIKNPNAATTRLIRSLRARTRFCLTGTPLENHLGELWSIFSFALPGFLGDLSSFNQAFRTPIEKKGDAARGRLLARRIRPFLLRRTKEEVAHELPPKTEIIERVEMAAGQRDVYESIRLSMHEKVRAAIAAKGFARSRIIILDALLKLRQCCCDPRLLKLSAKTSAKAGSAKLERLTEMLAELIEENRRVLMFSQFTSMLDLIRPELDARGVAYSLLTGDTRDRAGAIDDFQEERTSVFLISLKAGGVGLNLTSADTVILYDPWWNPAVEDQAIDRAHRIGQHKPVFVHKLVVSGTIEEKMAALKEKKRALAESLFDADGAPTLAMTEADLDMLFGPG
jgi:superfamily II DNA or RNA helicase